jgi:purine-binding chemotaxis protein CheW
MPKIDDQQIVNFTIGDVNYGVPVNQVREVRDMQVVTPVPEAPSYIDGVTNLRGQIITVMDLRKRLSIEATESKDKKIIVIEMSEATVGVVVDSVTEVSTIAGTDIESQMQVTKKLEDYLVGVGKQGEQLVVILDLAKIISDMKDDIPKTKKAAVKKPMAVEAAAVV